MQSILTGCFVRWSLDGLCNLLLFFSFPRLPSCFTAGCLELARRKKSSGRLSLSFLYTPCSGLLFSRCALCYSASSFALSELAWNDVDGERSTWPISQSALSLRGDCVYSLPAFFFFFLIFYKAGVYFWFRCLVAWSSSWQSECSLSIAPQRRCTADSAAVPRLLGWLARN